MLFQKNLIEGRPNEWKWRVGSRYLYICEDGLVHWCSQQRGYPGISLIEYTVEDIRREYKTQKECRPFCTLPCIHQASLIDEWRGKQTLTDPFALGGIHTDQSKNGKEEWDTISSGGYNSAIKTTDVSWNNL